MRAHPPQPGHGCPHSPGPGRLTGLLVLGLLVGSGCTSSSSGIGYRRGMVGSLRSSVTTLEAENQDLQKQLADVKAESRRLEDRLVQEEAHSAALAARLKSTRVSSEPGRSDDRSVADLDLDEPRRGSSTPRATPAGRSSTRKPPVAQIPGEIKPMPEDDFEPAPRSSSSRSDDASDLFPSASTRDDRSGGTRTSQLDDSRSRWLPVARGSMGTYSTIR